MKINITVTDDKFISGYNNILLQNLPDESQKIVNNSCNEIIATNIIDYVEQEQIDGLLKLLITKLRMGGSLVISGLNLDIIVRNLLNKTLPESDFNNMIKAVRSIHSRKYVSDLLTNNNLKIYSSVTKGHIYEIVATRS